MGYMVRFNRQDSFFGWCWAGQRGDFAPPFYEVYELSKLFFEGIQQTDYMPSSL